MNTFLLLAAILTVQKTAYGDFPEAGVIQTISRNPCGSGLVIGGRTAAILIEANAAPRVIPFARRAVEPRPRDIDGDGMCEFIDHGGGWQKVGVMNADGSQRWLFASGLIAAPNQMAAADIDGDGKVEFVVGLNARGGVVVIDTDGHTIAKWRGTNVFSVGLLDVDGDQKLEVVHVDGGRVLARKPDGTSVRGIPGVGRFTVVDGALLGSTVEGRFRLSDVNGRIVAEYQLPEGGHHISEAHRVPLLPDEAPYLVLTRTVAAVGKQSSVYIIDGEGKLVYQGAFASASAPIAIVDDGILVGENSRVWKLTVSR